MGAWVQQLVSIFGSAASGGVKYYQLDNEPDNWQALRTDIYPALYPPGGWCQPFYTTNASIGKSLDDDFKDRTMAYAKAVKAADPTANVLFMSTENAWDLHDGAHLPIYNAVAMYRNYDGQGGRFGAYSIGAASPNAGVNVYASADSPKDPTKVWVMLVNVSGTDQDHLDISVQNFTPTGTAAVYRADGGNARRPAPR